MAEPAPDIVIEEIVGGLPAITLSDRNGDLPFGRRHEIAAFETGVSIDIAEEGVFNPGSDRVVYPVMQPRYKPMVLKGAFRDVFGGQGFARFQRDAFLELAARANPVRISWANDEQQGILKEAVFGEESANDITYQLTFWIAVPVVGQISKRDKPQQTLDPEGLLAFMIAQAAKREAALVALAIRAEVNAILSQAFAGLDANLAASQSASTTFAIAIISSPHAILTSSQILQSACASAQVAATTLSSIVGSMRAADVMLSPSAENQRNFWDFQFDVVTLMLQIADSLRTTRQIALEAVRKSTRLYRVVAGDTLESIAASQLGSSMRSLDLGVPQSALVPGILIRIPEAA